MPYLPESRTYRNFTASNFKPVVRSLPEVGDDASEERVDEPSYKVRGYFTTFSQEYELYPRMGDWPAEYEQIDPHALDGVDTSDTIMQFDHSGAVLARTRNSSLVIGVDEHGGWCEADLSGCQQARDLYEAITNGLVDEMSFGFMIADDENGKGTTFTRDEQGDYHTTITRISRLYDVSAVSCPANANTEIHARSAIRSRVESDRLAAQEAARAAEEAEREQREEQERIAAQAASQRRKRMAAALRLASM